MAIIRASTPLIISDTFASAGCAFLRRVKGDEEVSVIPGRAEGQPELVVQVGRVVWLARWPFLCGPILEKHLCSNASHLCQALSPGFFPPSQPSLAMAGRLGLPPKFGLLIMTVLPG